MTDFWEERVLAAYFAQGMKDYQNGAPRPMSDHPSYLDGWRCAHQDALSLSMGSSTGGNES